MVGAADLAGWLECGCSDRGDRIRCAGTRKTVNRLEMTVGTIILAIMLLVCASIALGI